MTASLQPLPARHSVQPITQVWEDTNLNPVLVIADDLQAYVAKHDRGRTPCHRLRNEFLAYHFARLWGLPTLDAAMLKVDPMHVGALASPVCQPRYFSEHTCFATRFMKESTEFGAFLQQSRSWERDRFLDREVLMKVVLFDLWIANADRNGNNPNLLLVSVPDGFSFRVMDHDAVFHDSNLDKPLYPGSLSDTLLAHPAMPRLLGRHFHRNKALVGPPVEEAYFCVRSCRKAMGTILAAMPANWGLDAAELQEQLEQHLFTPGRLEEVIDNFRDLLEQCH